MSHERYGNSEFLIADRPVGPGHPCYVIAEAGANHNRDLSTALALIDVAADAGADAVKFQTYRAEGLYSRKTPMMSYVRDKGLAGPQETIWDMIKRVEMPWEWHSRLATHARQRGLHFLSTPFEEAAVDVLEAVGVPAYKIASYELGHLPLIELCAATGKPLLLSTAMASLGDIERSLEAANRAGAEEICVMHCAVNYPPRFQDLNLRAIATLRQAFDLPVGWSDHTMGHTADVVAVALGATVVEKHFTLSRDMAGPDHGFALEPDELGEMVVAIRNAEAALGSPVKRMAAAEAELASLGRRGVVVARALASGQEIAREDLAIKRPGFGIGPHELHAVVGRRTARGLEEEDILTWEDLA